MGTAGGSRIRAHWSALAVVALGVPVAAGAGPRLDISGAHRSRVERLDEQFRPTLDARDFALSLRTSVSFSAAWPSVQAVAEIMDSRAELNDSKSFVSTSVVNTVEPIRAFVSWRWDGGKAEGASGVRRSASRRRDEPAESRAAAGAEQFGFTLTAGRMTIDLGSRRLVARSRFRSTVSAFTGVDGSWHGAGGESVRAFVVSPTIRLPDSRTALLENAQKLDPTARDTRLSGLFYERPVRALHDRLELYALHLSADERDDVRDLATFGARLRRPAARGAWHYEIEAAVQSGTTGSGGGASRDRLDQSAHFVHADFGYAFSAAWSPDLSVLYDYASGDADPGDGRDGRFDTLYGARAFDYGPTGIYGPFARGNLETPGLRVTVAPAKKWAGLAEYRVHRLAEARDAWVGVGLRDASGASGRVLGRQLDGRVSWEAIEDRLGVEAGLAYFSKGRFVRRTAPERSGASTFFYAAVSVSF